MVRLPLCCLVADLSCSGCRSRRSGGLWYRSCREGVSRTMEEGLAGLGPYAVCALRTMVGDTGLEPVTSAMSTQRSNH